MVWLSKYTLWLPSTLKNLQVRCLPFQNTIFYVHTVVDNNFLGCNFQAVFDDGNSGEEKNKHEIPQQGLAGM